MPCDAGTRSSCPRPRQRWRRHDLPRIVPLSKGFEPSGTPYYAITHTILGPVRRIVVRATEDGQTRLDAEVAGAPSEPAFDRRRALEQQPKNSLQTSRGLTLEKDWERPRQHATRRPAPPKTASLALSGDRSSGSLPGSARPTRYRRRSATESTAHCLGPGRRAGGRSCPGPWPRWDRSSGSLTASAHPSRL